MNNKISLILTIPLLVVLTTATAYGLGYEVNQFKIVLPTGESKEFHRVILVEKDTPLGISFIGEGNEWFTLTSNNTALDEKRLKIPFTLSIPSDVEAAGDYMICMIVEQKGDSSGIIKINQSALIPIIVTVMDSEKPQRDELVFNRETVQEKCKIEEEQKQEVVEVPKLEKVESEKPDVPEDIDADVPANPDNTIDPEVPIDPVKPEKPKGQTIISKSDVKTEEDCREGTKLVDGFCKVIKNECESGNVDEKGNCKAEKSWSDGLVESINNFIDWIKNLF